GGGGAGDPAWEGDLPEQVATALLVPAEVRIELAVGAFQPCVGDGGRPAVAGAGDVDRVQVALPDRAVQVDVDQVQPGDGAEVAEQARLDVFGPQRLAEERGVQ